MKLLIYPPVEPERLEKICAAAGEMRVVNAESEAVALEEIVNADAMFGKITPRLLAAAKQLKWVQTATASLEHYVFPELIEHPLTLTNMRGLFSDVIADHVMGYILCFARNLHIYIRQQMEARYAPVGGEEQRSSFAAGTCWVSSMDRAHLHVSDCTLGIVGLGQIGSEIARRGRCFGMRVLAVDPYQMSGPEGVEAVWGLDQLPRLLGESDFVVVAAPHTPETEGMFQRAQFQQMKPSGYFINIGRGAIVSLQGLNAALDAGELAGAALDVFEIEPLPPEHPLWKQPNVILTPHVAACSVRLAERHLSVLLNNIHSFATGQPLENVVRKAKWF